MRWTCHVSPRTVLLGHAQFQSSATINLSSPYAVVISFFQHLHQNHSPESFNPITAPTAPTIISLTTIATSQAILDEQRSVVTDNPNSTMTNDRTSVMTGGQESLAACFQELFISNVSEPTTLDDRESIMAEAPRLFKTNDEIAEAEHDSLGQVEKTNDRDFETEHR